MTSVAPYPPVFNSEAQEGLGANNQAFEAYRSDAFTVPPSYPQQYLQQPQRGTTGYYPNPYPAGSVAYGSHFHPQQHHPSATVVVSAPPPPIIVQQVQPVASYCGMIVFACLVFWFCNVLFGFIAFILAVVAENNKYDDPAGAQKLGKASMWLSIVGIIVTIVIVAVILGVIFGTAADVVGGSFPQYPQSRYVSPSSCCSSNGYVYPGSGSYCYGTVYSYSSSCPYYSYLGTCYRYSYALTSSLCCYSYEDSYSSSYCYSY